jgi:hypothetical protein
MWSVAPPIFDAGDTFETCIARIRDQTLRQRLARVQPQIEAASASYELRAQGGELHLVPTSNSVGGTVTRAEMVALYDQRLAGKNGPGRSIYNAIRMLPEGDRCPFCDQRNVSTLDHVLPKGR